MAYRSILMALLCPVTIAPTVAANQVVPEGYVRVANAHGVPPEVLYSVSLAESSRKLPCGVRPWPWTLNVAGQGYRYETRLQAWQALQVFMMHYPHKRIDVGIAQVNLGWNGHRYFTSTWDAFDPYINLNVAAAILRKCWERKPGSWLDASGCYHHPAGGKPAARYAAIVKHHLAQITAQQSVTVFTTSLGFVWTEPTEPEH